jgi:hypothetical protein
MCLKIKAFSNGIGWWKSQDIHYSLGCGAERNHPNITDPANLVSWGTHMIKEIHQVSVSGKPGV